MPHDALGRVLGHTTQPRQTRPYPEPVTDEIPFELSELRHSIDNIDAALIHLLAERFKCTQQVGLLKAERGMPPADPAREERQIERLRGLAVDAGLDPVFAEKFLAFIVAEVIQHHVRISETGQPHPVPPGGPLSR